MEGSGVPEHSGGHQDFRECVHCAGSHGRALTLVSFTKGVSPPQRPAPYTWAIKTLTFTKKWHIRNSRVMHLCFNFPRDIMSKTRNSFIARTPLRPTSTFSTHQVMRSVWMRHLANSVSAIPRLPALRCSLMHTDINCSMCPLIRQ